MSVTTSHRVRSIIFTEQKGWNHSSIGREHGPVVWITVGSSVYVVAESEADSGIYEQ